MTRLDLIKMLLKETFTRQQLTEMYNLIHDTKQDRNYNIRLCDSIGKFDMHICGTDVLFELLLEINREFNTRALTMIGE